MAGSGMGKLRAPIFNGKDGAALTAAQKLALEENVAKDAKALGLIQNAQELRGDKKVRSVKLQALRREFEYIRMQEDDSLSDYITKLLELVNHMKAYGEEITDRRIVHKLLISLSIEYDSIAEVIKETKDTKTISVQEVISSLKSHEQRLQRHTEYLTEKAFSSLSVSPRDQSNTGQSGCSKSKKNWKPQKWKKRDAKFENNSKKENQAESAKFEGKPKCYECGRFSHIAKDCKGKPTQTANYAAHKEEEGTMFYACHYATVVQNNDVWYVDSACSNHMTSHESLLVNIDTNVTAKATGKGTLVIDTKFGYRYIKEVMLVPGLDENLLSVGQMVEHGYFLFFGKSMVEIFDDSSMEHLVAKVPMTGNRCFPLSLKYVTSLAMKATVEDSTWCWNMRFGHLNMQSLRSLQQQEMVCGLPEIESAERICPGCAMRKANRESFGKEKTWRASEPLEHIHSYKFKAMVELQSGYKIKRLRSDRGGEYTSLEFLKFCEDVGVERQLTVAYSPQ
ncbi:unnamed protein product [Prunus armeniaca]